MTEIIDVIMRIKLCTSFVYTSLGNGQKFLEDVDIAKKGISQDRKLLVSKHKVFTFLQLKQMKVKVNEMQFLTQRTLIQ